MSLRITSVLRRRFSADARYYKLVYDIFGIYPANIEPYKLALVHRSASVTMPDGSILNNERLEYLGDAVLETICSEYLFLNFPDMDEGFLTQTRSKVVSRATLNKLCVDIGLSAHVVSNAGGSFTQKHLYGDALEAMIGALYLDQGYKRTSKVVNKLFLSHIDLDEMTHTETDFKSRLIEWCQKNRQSIRFSTGYGEHSTAQSPVFRSVTYIEGMEVGYGLGSSKKEAEQRAAYSVSQFLSDAAGDNFLDMIDESMERLRSQSGDK